MIVNEQLARNEWKVGRIHRVNAPSPHVRKAEIKRVDGKIVLRDRTKIVLLELDCE